jgi:predicted  nucleic acid-binding Zn-ribbon protein
MKKMILLLCLIALGFLLAIVAYDDSTKLSAELRSLKIELDPIKAALQKTESERDSLKAKFAIEQQNNEQLQKKVNELNSSCEQLQKRLGKLTFLSDQSRQQFAEIISVRDKLKKQVVELNDSRNKLRQQYNELSASNNQLNKQVKELTQARDESAAKAQAAQKRIGILAAMLDSERQGLIEQQERLTVTNQAQGDKQPLMNETSEHPAAVTEVSRPSADPSQLVGRPTCHSFNTTRPQILPGQTSILSWHVSNADQIRIEPGIGSVSALGSVAVKPSTATTYTLIAINEAGQSRITCRIEVGDNPSVQ